MKNVLILCTGNSCRSQMAEGYFRHFTAPYNVAVYSAGIENYGVNPRAISTMAADGIDISAHTSNRVDEYAHITFDYIITVCDHAQENCPYIPSQAQRFHYNFVDPANTIGNEEEISTCFEEVRDQIKNYCKGFSKIHLNT